MTERTGPHQSLPESVARFKHCTSLPCSQIIASLPDVVIGERRVGGTMMGIDAQNAQQPTDSFLKAFCILYRVCPIR